MRTIYKYTLKPEEEQQLPLPRGSQLRSAIEQHGEIVCYAEVDQDEQQTELHTFHVYGTGHSIAHNGGGVKFLGTVKLGLFVFHVFHRPPIAAVKTTKFASGATLTEDEKGLLITQQASPEMIEWMDKIPK